ncbi:MAG: DUF378 domain-containing protein [Alphaproteobacteria bacterium]|nr:DUF378 domain-containing protein [Alphaproteobacteria bacterium]
MNIVIKILAIICLIGALNWGLIGIFGFDLVAAIFGPMSLLSRLVYSLVGLSAILLVVLSIRENKLLSLN